MRVLRGRAGDIETDRQRTKGMVATVAETDELALRVWTPHRQVAFGRRDAHEAGYEEAREAAEERGFPAVSRRTGGRAVAYTGSTVAFARAEPVADIRSGLGERYEAATADLDRALRRLGVSARSGEPPNSFCPGTHSLQAGGENGHQETGKVVGIAQRVGRGAALVAGVVIVDSATEIAAVLAPIYDSLDVPFDPESVGSLERAGGETDREEVLRTIERTLVGEEQIEVDRIENG